MSLTGLTPREQEVLHLIAEGLLTDEIAVRLALSPVTVRTHTGHLREKLGCRTRVELACYVWRERARELERELATLRAQTVGRTDLERLAHYALAVARKLEPLCTNGAH